MISIKTTKEIIKMRQAGAILSKVMQQLVPYVQRGISTLELDKIAEEFIRQRSAEPAFKGYGDKKNKYPFTLCTSVNEQVVHSLPHKNKILKQGDIISLDCGVKYKKYYADMAITVGVGEISSQKQKLISITRESLEKAVSKIKEGAFLGDISWAIQSFVEKHGFSVVRQLAGHGIGRKLHEEPSILNYGKPNTGPILKAGMTLAIEPMVNVGSWEVETLDDDWTVVTKDRKLSAHFEHTILVTKTGAEILTRFL